MRCSNCDAIVYATSRQGLQRQSYYGQCLTCQALGGQPTAIELLVGLLTDVAKDSIDDKLVDRLIVALNKDRGVSPPKRRDWRDDG